MHARSPALPTGSPPAPPWLLPPPPPRLPPPSSPPLPAAGEAWLWSRDGSSYMAAAAHFAHLLHERCWGLTPAGSGFCSGPLAISPRDQAPAPQGLVRMGSMSSVGQHH